MKKALGGSEEPPSQPLGGRRANAAPSGPDSIKPFSLNDNSDDDRAAREAKEQEERAAKAARMKKALGGGNEEPPSQPVGGRRANAAPSGPDTIKPFSLDADSDDDRAAREAKEQDERAAKAARMKAA